MNKANAINSLKEVLHFSSEMILMSLSGEKPDESIINDMKKHCKNLTENGIYNFNTECSEVELMKQIQEFASKVNG